uniref:Uncharacterized protein n=1 Tax=Leersia perrieri TaxID=77586 RepID=A0A0D9X4Q5_9ORYZ
MEFFQGVEFVRLRSWEHGTYVTADEDGRSVLLGSGYARGAVWAVEPLLAAGPPPVLHVRFRGAYGRYLGVPGAGERRCGGGCGCCFPLPSRCCLLGAAQLDRGEEEVGVLIWRPIRCADDVIADHDARGVVLLRDGVFRYLHGGGGVSVDGNVNDDTTLRWEVVAVPRTHDMPDLPIEVPDFRLLFRGNLFVRACFPRPLQREIRFVAANDDGTIAAGEEDWTSFQFTGRSVGRLTAELASRVGYDVMACVCAGNHGAITPLLIDLPRSRETLRIVLLRHSTPGYDQMIFPDMNALYEVATPTIQ